MFSASSGSDQARDVFGLGGTPDDALPERIALLTTRPNELHKLAMFARRTAS